MKNYTIRVLLNTLFLLASVLLIGFFVEGISGIKSLNALAWTAILIGSSACSLLLTPLSKEKEQEDQQESKRLKELKWSLDYYTHRSNISNYRIVKKGRKYFIEYSSELYGWKTMESLFNTLKDAETDLKLIIKSSKTNLNATATNLDHFYSPTNVVKTF